MKPAAPTQQCAVKPLIATLLGSGLNGPLEALDLKKSLRLATTAPKIRQMYVQVLSSVATPERG